MWLQVVVYLVIYFTDTLTFEIWNIRNEPLELTDLFLENLKADPLLQADHEISMKSKRFIDTKIEKFIDLVSQSQNALFSRTKRSLDDRENNITRFSINITSEKIIPTEYSDDVRFFKHSSVWFAVSLQDKFKIVIFQYENGFFNETLKRNIEYSTNIAVLSLEEVSLIVAGEKDKVIMFQFNPAKNDLRIVQISKVENPQHVILWEQDRSAYLSITDHSNHQLQDNKDKKSTIQIFQWLGRHFDLIQEIDLVNIKKTVPFSVHGSHFLAAVKYEPHEGEMNSYSEIFKFDLHSTKFKVYQRLLTNGCTDIKYFMAELHGDRHHFLVVVHSAGKDFIGNASKSVIYKYEDQYFIPFQSIQINAIEWQPIQDLQGHAALIAVTEEGLKGFQYDGWHFFESPIVSDDHISLKFEDITALHTYHFEGEEILVLACDHCKNTTNVFKIKFSNRNTMKEVHSEIMSWCTKSLKDLESNEESDFVAESLRGDLNEQISLEEDQKRQLSAALSGSNEILINLEDLVDNSLRSNQDYIFNVDVHADNVIFNDDVNFKSLQTDWLNDFNVDNLFDNVLDIAHGFVLENSPAFSVVVSEKTLTPKIINGVLLERYIFVDDNVTLDNLIVNGSVTFENGVNVETVLNNVTVNGQTLLLKTGDQAFSGDMIVNDIIVHNLTATNLHYDERLIEKHLEININNEEINHLSAKIWNPEDFESLNQGVQPISHIKTLKVQNLDVGGLLNRVSVPVLEKHALKKAGDQVLEKTLFVDSLHVDRLNVIGNLSGTNVPEDFVMVNGGEYIVNQDVNFLKGLKVNKLEVLYSLNNITVTNEGELDILLTDSPKMQSIPTRKSFHNLIITNPIKLRNKIKNAQMERINPVIIDSDSYQLDGDVTIEGLTEVRRWLKVGDFGGQDGERSWRDLLEKGLKITDTQIPVHLTFTQPLDLEDTVADRVNLLNPHDWLLYTSDSPQIVNGPKNFASDLHLDGPVNAFRINDVDVHKLQTDVLRVEDDQEVGGALEVESVVAEKGVTSNNTFYGDNLSVNRNETSEELSVINGTLRANVTKVKHLVVKGLVNSFNISETLKDIVARDAENKVFGLKEFKELHVDSLVVHGEEWDLITLLKDVINNEATLSQNMELNNNITVENIDFTESLNNITREDFNNMMDMTTVTNDMTTVSSDRTYDEITVFGEVFVSDNCINGKNLSSIENDTVKTDEDHEFNNVNFGEAVLVQNSIELKGNVENLDLEEIVDQYSNAVMEIEDKIFGKNVFIDGNLNVEGLLNGVNLRDICEFSRTGRDLKALRIEGDVIFVKGPKILNINGLGVAGLMENLWFVDKKATISGNLRLQNTTFYSPVHVQEFIDETNLKLLSQNYFSKSKDQAVPAGFSFDNVTFTNISTPKLTTNGPINGIVLDDLLKTMLLQNVSQIFESPAYLEEVQVQTLDEGTSYSVNDLNLKTDVMLYDALNTVTGRKIVKNLNAERVKVNHNVQIQDVDVLDWLSNALLTNGTFSVTGKTVLKDAVFKQGLSLRGNLNDQEFTEKTVMLVDTPQNITGQKSFVSSEENIAKFKILRVKGLVNDMHLESFVQNLPNKSQNNIMNSEIVFNNSVVVKNINIDVMYNDVNITELLHNITELGALEQFQQQYEDLLNMSLVVQNSVKNRASFFKYFKEIKNLKNVYEVYGVRCKDDVFRLLTFTFANGTNIFKTYEWNVFKREFIYTGENIESYSIPSFMEQISIEGKDYIYVEHPANSYRRESYGQPHVGQLLQLTNARTFEAVAQFHRNSTTSLISFVPPGTNRPCLGFIDVGMSGMEILCDTSGSHTYHWFQTITLENVYKATTVRTADSLYLFLARHGLPFKEPSIVVLESLVETPEFKEKQTIFEGADLNGLSAAVISNVPHVAFSFGPREAAVDSGRISIRKLHPSTHQFVQWQHIPLTAPLGAHFVTETSFEPLLLAPSADASSPLQTLRYDGSAGFKKSLKGAALPPKSRIRLIEGGKFLVALQDDRKTGVVLGAVIKGPLRN